MPISLRVLRARPLPMSRRAGCLWASRDHWTPAFEETRVAEFQVILARADFGNMDDESSNASFLTVLQFPPFSEFETIEVLLSLDNDGFV